MGEASHVTKDLVGLQALDRDGFTAEVDVASIVPECM